LNIRHESIFSRRTLEWGGALFALLGSWLNVLIKNDASWSYGVYMFSSLLFIGYALRTRCYGILLMHVCFVASNLVGIYTRHFS
jgi:hypothetical protein